MPCSPRRRILVVTVASRNSPAPRRLTPVPPPQVLDRSDDGQDHTVLPYAALPSPPCGLRRTSPLWPKSFIGYRRRSYDTACAGLTGFGSILRPPCPHIRAGAAASTASPTHVRDDVRSPLSIRPGWRDNAVKPNFGKVEYFCGRGLTGCGGRRVFCPTGRARYLERLTPSLVSRQPRRTIEYTP